MSGFFYPVVLFVYARPEHTLLTVQSLAKNAEALHTDLIVYSDAPKNNSDMQNVEKVRSILHKIEGFKSVAVYERRQNFGLADSIVSGVTEVVNEYGGVIVLEDDVVVSSYFLRYMNDALRLYADEHLVMHIAAYMPEIDNTTLPETFFMRQSSCWGWGTWARAWKYFSRDSGRFLCEFTPEMRYRFNLDGVYDYWRQLVANHEGLLKTWAVFWYASVFTQSGLCLHPRTSLVMNIGFDGSGTNCGVVDQKHFLSVSPVPVLREALCENAQAMGLMKVYLGGKMFPEESNGVCDMDTKGTGMIQRFSNNLPAWSSCLFLRAKQEIAHCFDFCVSYVIRKSRFSLNVDLEDHSDHNLRMWIQDETTCLFPAATIRNSQNNAESIVFGKYTYVRGDIFVFEHGGKITLGDYCYVGEGSRIWSASNIIIGNRVLISHNVNIFDSDTHPIDDAKARHEQFVNVITTGNHSSFYLNEAPVVIEDDVLIGCQAIILSGVRIGKCAIVGAGSVVTKDVPEYTVVAGNPARVVRRIHNEMGVGQ